MFSAWGVSAVVSQYVLSRLLDTYALDGAMLLFGGVLMHSVPIVMLAKNPSAFSVRCRRFKPALDGFDVSKSYGTEKRSTNQEEGFVTHEAMNTRQGATFIQALALFSAPAFYVLLVTIVAGDYICTEFTKTVVDYGVDKGMELSTSKQLLTFFAAGQLLGRIALPLMADLLPLCRHPHRGSAVCACGGITGLHPVHEVRAGRHLSGRPPYGGMLRPGWRRHDTSICSESTDSRSIRDWNRLSEEVVLITSGLFRDTTGSYDNFYWMLGAVSLVCFFVFLTFHIVNVARKKAHYAISHNKDQTQNYFWYLYLFCKIARVVLCNKIMFSVTE
ncbi:hypothetical protein V5799_000066 [Amblyomma americanum]|uniref:Uncharacterized protein n=1 Tax=Amblyomma americanum TaxID=6943 RepID=A0AAQ4D441_AMBAM